jgi:hypothetical protein
MLRHSETQAALVVPVNPLNTIQPPPTLPGVLASNSTSSVYYETYATTQAAPVPPTGWGQTPPTAAPTEIVQLSPDFPQSTFAAARTTDQPQNATQPSGSTGDDSAA